MALDLDAFVLRRPYLFHLTAATNVGRIQRTRVLQSAGALFGAAERLELLRQRRADGILVRIGDDEVYVRDQAPLHRGNMELGNGWSFEDFVEHLNGRVFFWPGTVEGPIAYGRRHFERYRDQGPALLRVGTAALIAANQPEKPLFCRFNSGSPRCSGGHPSPRGANTFRAAEGADFSAAQTVEVTYLRQARLPPGAELSTDPDGPWENLF